MCRSYKSFETEFFILAHEAAEIAPHSEFTTAASKQDYETRLVVLEVVDI